MDTTPTPTWAMACLLAAVTFQLTRVAMDLIQVANADVSPAKKTTESKQNLETETKESSKPTTTYGSASVSETNNGTSTAADEDPQEGQPLLSKRSETQCEVTSRIMSRRGRIFMHTWMLLTATFCAVSLFGSTTVETLPWIAGASAAVSAVDVLLWLKDKHHERYGAVQRFFHLSAVLVLWTTAVSELSVVNTANKFMLAAVSIVVLLAVLQGWFPPVITTPIQASDETMDPHYKPTLSRKAILTLLKPYFWPDATDSTAFRNRIRAIATWFCVISSKVCSLTSPLLLGWASTALAHQDYEGTVKYAIGYSLVSWAGSTLQEGQSLVYLKVSQAAFVQLAETTFGHLHRLSLEWHLRKKLGETLRSLDRGVAACDTLMMYLFLWLIPALVECITVCIIFAVYFQYLPLAVSVFYFVFVYIVWTILVTLWRKTFRKALVHSDNAWHDQLTDSLVNFETVKSFTGEKYEVKRFGDAVSRYQTGDVKVQGSLSLLNVSQQFILQSCLATSLSLAAWGIRQRSNCCIELAGCESAISKCCQAVTSKVCPGMQVGDFVAVLTYTLNLFSPLNYLGFVYNVIVMAMIDLTNLSELLAENPDVVDAADAIELPTKNAKDPDIAVEFDNVIFNYPSQNKTKGLHSLSFKMKRGTTTAIVGSTGAGKTTISRLLFRFYDVLGGAVKVNGVDVRAVTQESLRGAIGVVPQQPSMFNDTIRSNLLYGRRDATQEELEQAVRDAQLLDFIDTLDEGWETVVGDRGLKLSGGEKQRAAIARCLLKDPPFVLLDEATSSLDSLTESGVQEALDRLGADRTVLVIAHRLGTIRNVDNIVVLKNGRVAEEGTHDELLVKGGQYAAMWNIQLHSASASVSTESIASLVADLKD